jgi:pimeloyl-ACP methyl ester carboxylesterase
LASKLFFTPPAPKPLSGKMTNLLAKASDRFTVGLTTSFGIEERCRLSVAVWGRGPAVYLVHGWGGRAGQWVSFIEPLVSAGFTAVAFDAPMHGESPAERTSILHFAAALSAVVDSVGPARMVVGHSAGAAAASLALRSELVANTRVLETDGVVLIGSPAAPGELFKSYMRRVGIPEQLLASLRADAEARYGFEWDILTVRPPARPTAALIVHDREDSEIPYADAERIAGIWPDSTLFTTSGLGHQRILRDQRVVHRIVELAQGIGPSA